MFNTRRHAPTLAQKRERAERWMRDNRIKHLQAREAFSDVFAEDVGQARGRAIERKWLDGLRAKGAV